MGGDTIGTTQPASVLEGHRPVEPGAIDGLGSAVPLGGLVGIAHGLEAGTVEPETDGTAGVDGGLAVAQSVAKADGGDGNVGRPGLSARTSS